MGLFVHTVYLGIGSNLGDRQKNCERALELLKSSKIAKSIIISNWYKTKPLFKRRPTPFGGTPDWPDFINGAARLETELEPHQLLKSLHEIEAKLGRIRTGEKWGPRTIDLDILFYDDIILAEPALTIPHPEAHKRMFVLEPLCDIAPSLIHPVLKMTITSLRDEVEAISRMGLLR